MKELIRERVQTCWRSALTKHGTKNSNRIAAEYLGNTHTLTLVIVNDVRKNKGSMPKIEVDMELTLSFLLSKRKMVGKNMQLKLFAWSGVVKLVFRAK